ncbi:Leucine-rich repeats and immunoglobulin-like domains protein 3 [Pseudolycoriella hygida]|uniref:Leucine-rich repeats and immunoglobulin-like domains protein 3 n=1 Tax=Pseudolycoriella hygida TaxID=35572 RepID=A0A9Q0S2E2_9DIPT|nr:Leucine-rich repeats and immunoglobulin-like domains protein 3 [Pseudolycoriella hygida]
MKMSSFSLDIRWWIFGIITLGQLFVSDCVKENKTYGLFVNENSDKVVDAATTHEYKNQETTEIGCPLKCSCLGDLADCSKNDFDEIPSIPTWAKKLDLSQNKLTDFDVEQDITDLTNIQNLNLNKNHLVKFPILRGLELDTLKMEQNFIEIIPPEALLALPQLTVLYLNKNGIKSVLPNTFPSSNRLKSLHLNYNSMRHLEDSSFNSLKDLIELKLNQNKLTSLPMGVFKSLKRLSRLELNGNQLTDVPYGMFQNLTNLRVLKLRNNNISNMTIGAFFGLKNLGTLELDGNQITKIEKSAFFNLTKLKTLTLTNNRISNIDPYSFEFCARLISLDLSFNELSTITATTFEPLSHIKHLSLSNNKITWIADGTFNMLSTLESLDMSNNQIFLIIEDANAPFSALNRLSRFELQGNQIKTIHHNVFNELGALSYLDLTGNNITSIQNGAFSKLTMLKDLFLNTTNLICDCNLRWFQQFLMTREFRDVNVICGYPAEIAGKVFSTLSEEQLMCSESPSPRIIEEPLSQLAVLGTNVTLNCTAIASGSSAMIFKWKRDNFELSPRHIVTESRVDPLTNNTITTSKLVMTDIRNENGGKYQCIVSNLYGTSYSQKVKIVVASLPEFQKVPINVTLKSNSNVRLDCAATGDPIPQIAWQKDGGDDFPAARERRMHVMPQDDAFFIVNAKIHDQGVYTCTAQNAVGTIKANATVNIVESPSFVKPMENKEVNCGKTAVIECMSSGSPKPQIEWLKDHKPIEATERHFFAADDQLLIIVGTETSDSGTYTCQMQNNLGLEFGHMQLKVKPVSSTNFVNIDEMTGIVIITIVCCAVGTSIIWVVIIYQTKKGGLCGGGGGSATSVETVENTNSTGASIVVRQFPVYVSVNDQAKGGYGATSHTFSYDDLGHNSTMRLGDATRTHEEMSALINQNPIISRRGVPQAIGENFETDDSEEESVFNPSSLSDDRSGNTVTNEMASIDSSANVLKQSPTDREDKQENSSINNGSDVADSASRAFSETVVVLQKQQPVVQTIVDCNTDI